jgi:hypothetical protein
MEFPSTGPKVIKVLRFQVRRKEIERCSTKRALKWLHQLVSTRSIAWENRNSLALEVSGYDQDPRELYQIPEVCSFFKKLHKSWPYWFFFSTHLDQTLTVLECCIAGAEHIQVGVMRVDADDSAQFFAQCTSAMNHIFDTYRFPEEENKRIFFGIVEFQKQRAHAGTE